jgi:hypothetical protein
MAGRLSTTGIADGERARKDILGQLELAEQCKFALAKPGGFGTFGLRFHLAVILLQELEQSKQDPRVRR